jgi:hypothetical protein
VDNRYRKLAVGLILFAIWLALAIYGVAGLCIMLWGGLRALWGLLPEPATVVERRERIEHDRALVEAGRVPGFRR